MKALFPSRNFTSNLFLITLLSYSCVATAAETKRVVTPRGAALEVTVHQADRPHSPTLVIAPGQSCNSKGPLFETFGQKAAESGFTVVRFEWAYCLKNPEEPTPSEGLVQEIEDYNTVLKYTIAHPAVDSGRVVLAGKSLGSLVAYEVFKNTPDVKALALLTPLCVDEHNQPEAEKNYSGLSAEKRPVTMIASDKDTACPAPALFDFLKNSHGNISASIVSGDHGYRVKRPDGTHDAPRTQRNIDLVVQAVFHWADMLINP